jgi:hypothetical protein
MDAMRDLFSDLPPITSLRPPVPESRVSDERRLDKLAKDFVRWCCSFGDSFRNSPDIANLRFWLPKAKFKLRNGEEFEVLEAARSAYLKHIDQLMKKSENAN